MDELNFSILLDNKMAELAMVYEPHYNVPDLGIYSISGNLNLPSTSCLTLCNYLSKKEPEVDNCEIYSALSKMNG